MRSRASTPSYQPRPRGSRHPAPRRALRGFSSAFPPPLLLLLFLLLLPLLLLLLEWLCDLLRCVRRGVAPDAALLAGVSTSVGTRSCDSLASPVVIARNAVCVWSSGDEKGHAHKNPLKKRKGEKKSDSLQVGANERRVGKQTQTEKTKLKHTFKTDSKTTNIIRSGEHLLCDLGRPPHQTLQ